jgi:hypothetical protein
MIRNSLGKVKNREDLNDFVKKVGRVKRLPSSRRRIWFNILCAIITVMAGSFASTLAQACSLITVRSFKACFELADAIWQQAFDYDQCKGGPAKVTLSFHPEKLMEIRQFAA